MTGYRKLAVAAVAVMGLAMFTPKANAQLLDEQVKVTFSGPVDLPGRVLLPGTYVFEEVDPRMTRVFTADGKIVGNFLTVPEERQEGTGNEMITLRESPKGSPERVSAWFYPGDSVGSEFLYSGTRSRHKLTAKAVLAPPEFMGKEAERAIVDSATAIGHAFRALV